MPAIRHIQTSEVLEATDSIRTHAVQVLRIFAPGPRLISPEDAVAIGAHLASIVTHADSLNLSCRRPITFNGNGTHRKE